MSNTTTDFKTVSDVLAYVQPLVNEFRRFQSEKDIIVEKLRVVFDPTSSVLEIVVKDGQFAESFQHSMGKGRMKALRKLLNCVDQSYYQQINFRCD